MLTEKNRTLSVRIQENGTIQINPEILDPELKYLKPLDGEDDNYYGTPISFDFLTQLLRENSTHETCIFRKTEMLMAGYQNPIPALSYDELEAAILDYWLTGNFYLIERLGRNGELERFEHLPARLLRRLKKKKGYGFLKAGVIGERVLPEARIVHIKRYSPENQIYGLPEYLSAIPDIILKRSAKEYRHRFYVNGSHGRLIITNFPNPQMTNAKGELEDSPQLQKFKDDITQTKNRGQHKSVHVNIDDPGTKAEDFLNVVELGQKIEEDGFEKTCNESRISIINAHGIHPEIVGIVNGNRSSPNFERLLTMIQRTVIYPVQNKIMNRLNAKLSGSEKIQFVQDVFEEGAE